MVSASGEILAAQEPAVGLAHIHCEIESQFTRILERPQPLERLEVAIGHSREAGFLVGADAEGAAERVEPA